MKNHETLPGARISPRRRWFNVLCATSLVAFIALTALRVLGHVVLYESQDGLSNSFSDRGAIYLKHRSTRGAHMVDAVSIKGRGFYFLAYQTGTRPDGQYETWLFFMTMPLVIVTGIMPGIWLYRHFRSKSDSGRGFQIEPPPVDGG